MKRGNSFRENFYFPTFNNEFIHKVDLAELYHQQNFPDLEVAIRRKNIRPKLVN